MYSQHFGLKKTHFVWTVMKKARHRPIEKWSKLTDHFKLLTKLWHLAKVDSKWKLHDFSENQAVLVIQSHFYLELDQKLKKNIHLRKYIFIKKTHKKWIHRLYQKKVDVDGRDRSAVGLGEARIVFVDKFLWNIAKGVFHVNCLVLKITTNRFVKLDEKKIQQCSFFDIHWSTR